MVEQFLPQGVGWYTKQMITAAWTLFVALIFFFLGRYTVHAAKSDITVIREARAAVKRYRQKKSRRDEIGAVEPLTQEQAEKIGTKYELEEKEMEALLDKHKKIL